MRAQEEYAKALFLLTEELGISCAALSDIELCRMALEENPSYIALADTPALAVPVKLSLIDEAFAAVTETVRNLLIILCEHHSVYLFPAIAKEYLKLYNEARGIIPAEAITAVALTDEEKAKIVAKLEGITGKTVILKNTVDESILGGITLRYSGTQLDGSLRSRLQKLERLLKGAIV